MGEVTYQQTELLLRLYELRRESRLREARDWFLTNFHVTTLEDVMRLCPPGSGENALMRMVVGYWEMACGIVNRGLIDEEFFFENSGEHWVVWERLKPIAAAWRALFQNPHLFAQIEKNAARFEAWREERAPGSNDAVRVVMAQGRSAAASKS